MKGYLKFNARLRTCMSLSSNFGMVGVLCFRLTLGVCCHRVAVSLGHRLALLSVLLLALHIFEEVGAILVHLLVEGFTVFAAVKQTAKVDVLPKVKKIHRVPRSGSCGWQSVV